MNKISRSRRLQILQIVFERGHSIRHASRMTATDKDTANRVVTEADKLLCWYSYKNFPDPERIPRLVNHAISGGMIPMEGE